MITEAWKLYGEGSDLDRSTRFASTTIRPGYNMVIGCGNTVVHVSLDGKTDVLKLDEETPPIQFVLEVWGYLFVFPDSFRPQVYKNSKLVRVLREEFANCSECKQRSI